MTTAKTGVISTAGLLAIADRIEYQTYSKEDSKRITNAKRYMTAFYQRPYDTWRIIEQSIQPYSE